MDRNKARRVIECGLEVARCCGTCDHFVKGEGDWGICEELRYFHLKHQRDSGLSVHRYHTCEDGAKKWAPRFGHDEARLYLGDARRVLEGKKPMGTGVVMVEFCCPECGTHNVHEVPYEHAKGTADLDCAKCGIYASVDVAKAVEEEKKNKLEVDQW